MRTIFSRDIYKYSPLKDITLTELSRVFYINLGECSNAELGEQIEKYDLGRHFLLEGIRITKSKTKKLMG